MLGGRGRPQCFFSTWPPGTGRNSNTFRNETRLIESEATAVVDLFFDEINATLAKGDRVEIQGLCSFYVKKYKVYAGRNPKTGEPTKVKPKKLPFFKC